MFKLQQISNIRKLELHNIVTQVNTTNVNSSERPLELF